MTLTDLLIPAIAFILGIVAAYLFFSVVLVEVKKGKGNLTREEGLIKKAVEEGRVSWRTVFLKDGEMGEFVGIQ